MCRSSTKTPEPQGSPNDDAFIVSNQMDLDPVSNDWDLPPRSLTKAIRTVIKPAVRYRSGKKIKNFIHKVSHVSDLIIDVAEHTANKTKRLLL
jgi:hypothetical protein